MNLKCIMLSEKNSDSERSVCRIPPHDILEEAKTRVSEQISGYQALRIELDHREATENFLG